jgi:hypothetical protein
LREYREMTGIEGEVYVVEIGSGGDELKAEV